MTEEQNKKTLLIQKQNDVFRKQAYKAIADDHTIRGKWVKTNGIDCLNYETQIATLELIHNFSDFTEDNDPHGEHDFGAFTVEDQKIFWKIDYYDTNYEMGSEDPSDLTITRRVLTVMLASEY